MNIKEQLRKNRNENNMTQDQIAEMIYVSRQTISNWENGKSYPDIKSLLLLSDIYNISLDEIVRGDIDMMKKEISKKQWIKSWKKYSYAMFFFVILFMVSFIFKGRFSESFRNTIFIVTAISGILILYFSFRLEKIKKNKNLKNFKDILTFLNEDRI